ncbi:MAG: hypothetical protein EZS28_056444, partial [Streblomastix strix]
MSPVQANEGRANNKHLCPSAPDFTPSYPFNDRDPFVLDETPSILFAGGASIRKFSSKIIEGLNGQKCLLLALPSFAYTGDIVIVDPVTLIPRVIHFGIGLTDLKLHT